MQKYIRRLLLGTTVLTIIGTITLVPLKGQQINNDTKKTMKVLRRADHLGSGPSEQEVLDDLPITDAFSTEPSEPNKKTNREKKSTRYNKLATDEITEAEYPVNVILYTHWSQGLPALPINESDTVILARITDSQAFLSSDRTGVYSEFTADVKEVFKNATDTFLDASSTIAVQRLGGAVRFPSGSIQRYSVSDQRMPRKGRTYVLFVNRIEQNDFKLITAYEVQGQQITPLDGNGLSRLPFEVYRNTDAETFFEDLRASIVKSEGRKDNGKAMSYHFANS